MDKLLLLDVRGDKHYTSNTVADLALSTGRVEFDCVNRRVVVDGEPDSVSFSTDFDHVELISELARRAIQSLCRNYGFALYRNDAL